MTAISSRLLPTSSAAIAARGGLREDDRRELREALVCESLRVQRLHHLTGGSKAEVRGDAALEPGSAPAPVARPDGVIERFPAEVAGATPVSTDRSDRRQAEHAALRRDPAAVRSEATDDAHAPGAVGAGATDGEGVVAQDVLTDPSAPREAAVDAPIVHRKVGAGETEHAGPATGCGIVGARHRPAVRIASSIGSRKGVVAGLRRSPAATGRPARSCCGAAAFASIFEPPRRSSNAGCSEESRPSSARTLPRPRRDL
jgi:hypothetical protein